MNRSTFIASANDNCEAVNTLAGRLAAKLTPKMSDDQLYNELRTLKALVEHAKLAEIAVRLALRGPYDKRKLKS